MTLVERLDWARFGPPGWEVSRTSIVRNAIAQNAGLVRGIAAVDRLRDAMVETGAVAREPDDGGGDLLGLGKAVNDLKTHDVVHRL